MSDEERIRRVATGDRRALEQLYDQFHRLVYSFALKVLRDPHASEEVVQDVFMRIWTQAGKFDPKRGRFSSWLINITRNIAIDRVRSSRLRGMVPLVRPDESERDVIDLTVDLADATVTAVHVREALNVLSAEQREALDLAYWHGYTHTEIARRVKVPIGTVKSRLHHALMKLRNVLYTDGRKEGANRGTD
jgi:RNA polymerase sigma-70 factor, ECF subfamily